MPKALLVPEDTLKRLLDPNLKDRRRGVVSLVEKPYVFMQNKVRVFHDVIRFGDKATAS